MAKRLARAKSKIRDAGIRLRMPAREDLAEPPGGGAAGGLPRVHRGPQGQHRRRAGPAASCATPPIRLARAPQRAAARRARGHRPARAAAADRRPPGAPAPAPPASWCCWPTRTAASGTRPMIAEGGGLVSRRCARAGPARTSCTRRSRPATPPPGRGRHRLAADRVLYGELLRYEPTAVVEANRAIAVAMAEGPAAGLVILDAVGHHPQLAAGPSCTSPGPTCWPGWAGTTRPRPPTGRRWSWTRPPPSATSSPAAWPPSATPSLTATRRSPCSAT